MGRNGVWILVCLLDIMSSAFAQPLQLAANRWAPYTDRTLPDDGVATELVRTALRRAGYASEYNEVPWARALHGLQQGEYDVVICAWYSEERARYGYFSAPYLINRIRLVTRKDSTITFDRLSDLYGHPIAIVRGYAYDPSFDNDPRLDKVSVTSFDIGARMLEAGRVDLTLEDEFVARRLFADNLAPLAAKLTFLPQPLTVNGLHILVRRSRPDFQAIADGFDRAILDMRADGTFAAILARYGLQ